MYITVNDIISLASFMTAGGVIIGAILTVYRWYLKQEKQDDEIKAIKEEQRILLNGILACLDGLSQLGANHTVPIQRQAIEEYLNEKAHN